MKEIALQDNIQTILSHPVRERQGPEQTGESFGDMLKGAVSQVNKLQKEAGQAIHELATCQKKDIHQTMIAMEKAEVSFQLMMQVRNKIIGAYEQIMRMQV
jgi:flagellar hook-basal body complex protein FliE